MKIGYEHIYESYQKLLIHSENISWSRLQNLLTINSILVVAWATLFSTCKDNCCLSAKIVMTAISILGLFTGIVWAGLGKSGRQYLERYREKLQDIETRHDKAFWWQKGIPISDRPFRIQAETGRFSSSTFLLVWTPRFFALLSFILLIATWWPYVVRFFMACWPV